MAPWVMPREVSGDALLIMSLNSASASPFVVNSFGSSERSMSSIGIWSFELMADLRSATVAWSGTSTRSNPSLQSIFRKIFEECKWSIWRNVYYFLKMLVGTRETGAYLERNRMIIWLIKRSARI